MAYRGYFDGGSRGNPGIAGAGAVLYDPTGAKVWEGAKPLGRCTNNEAEYLAASMVLDEALRRGVSELELLGDSKLVIQQLSGAWKIKEPRLQALANSFKKSASGLSLAFTWIPRSDNSDADRLANLAMDGERLDSPLDSEEVAEKGPLIPEMNLEAAVVSQGEDRFLVDIVRKRCSCDEFAQRGDCPHLSFCLELMGTSEQADPRRDRPDRAPSSPYTRSAVV